MALASSAVTSEAVSRRSWNPLKFSGTELPTELLIMVKSLALVVLLTNHARILPDPWLPFVPGIDRIPPVLFQRTLQTVFVISALALMFNRRVRLASLALGSVMLLAVISSKAYYGNNKTFCGLMFFLTGLHVPGRQPWFLRWQLGITYFGAGLNKLLDVDWHTGIFFENWAVNRLHHSWYIALDSLLPPMALARFICWTTIVTELGIVPCIFLPRLYYWVICANILFQSGLLLFTGTTFTLFFYSMSAASLAFVIWPAGPLPVLYDADFGFAGRARRFFQPWDLDGMFVWKPRQPDAAARSWLALWVGNKIYTGFRALRMIVLLNPLTYLVLAGLIAAVPDVQGSSALYRRVIVAFSLFLLMPPLAWIADKVFPGGDREVAKIVPNSAGNRVTEA
jgi:hypothetical protein